MDGDSQDDIARIEARIEELSEALARCGKISFAAKLAVGAGFLWLVLTLLGLVSLVFSVVVASMAAIIGGIVLLGSNATTWTQTEDALKKSEAMRAELIGQLDLRTVDSGLRRLQ
jgi:uncharacterized membrane protein